MKVLIAGTGLGGLSLALALQRRGIDFTAFDIAQELKPLGVGINLLPHAVGELAEFDIIDAIEAASVRTRDLRYVNKFGQHIISELRGRYAGHELSQYSIHRGTLHGIMLAAVRQRAGADAVREGHGFVSFEQTATPDIWSWQYRIGHHIKTGRLKAPSRKLALRGVHRKIDHDLRDIHLRTSSSDRAECG